MRFAVISLMSGKLPPSHADDSGTIAMTDSNETAALCDRAADGDDAAVGELCELHRDRLIRIVQFRLDQRIRGRVDAADVIQEAFVETTKRFHEYLDQREEWPFFVWLRYITLQKLMQVHRHHLNVKARNADRDVSIFASHSLAATSVMLADRLAKQQTSPSLAAARAEQKKQVEQALDLMDQIDREVIALRHFEYLGNGEVASVLQISTTAANNRYVRALQRLKRVFDDVESAG